MILGIKLVFAFIPVVVLHVVFNMPRLKHFLSCILQCMPRI